jgi:hypothetical protein
MRKTKAIFCAVMLSLLGSMPVLAYFPELAPWAGNCAQSQGAAPGCGTIPQPRQAITPQQQQQMQQQQQELNRLQELRRAREEQAKKARDADAAGLAAQSRGEWFIAANRFMEALTYAPNDVTIRLHLERADAALSDSLTAENLAYFRQRIEDQITTARLAGLRQSLEDTINTQKLQGFYQSFLIDPEGDDPKCIGDAGEKSRRAGGRCIQDCFTRHNAVIEFAEAICMGGCGTSGGGRACLLVCAGGAVGTYYFLANECVDEENNCFEDVLAQQRFDKARCKR